MSINNLIALFRKEYNLMLRNKIFIMFTVVLMLAMIGLYYVLPENLAADEPALAVFTESPITEFFQAWDEGIKAVPYERLASSTDLIESVKNSKHVAGIIITDSLWNEVVEGRQAKLTLFIGPGLSDEHVQSIRFILEVLFSEVAYRTSDKDMKITVQEIFIGDDIMDDAVPLKQRMIPLLISLLLIMEVFSLGISIVEEKESHSIRAVLTAPVDLAEFLVAKCAAGVSFIFIQLFAFLFAIEALKTGLIAIALIILAAALFITGISTFLAAFSQDMMGLISKGVFVMILLVVPLFGLFFPGMFSSWMRLIPTFMIAESLNLLINGTSTFFVLSSQIGMLCIISIATFSVGLICIRRNLLCQ